MVLPKLKLKSTKVILIFRRFCSKIIFAITFQVCMTYGCKNFIIDNVIIIILVILSLEYIISPPGTHTRGEHMAQKQNYSSIFKLKSNLHLKACMHESSQ